MLAKAGESDRAIRVKMVRLRLFFLFCKFHSGSSWTLGVGALTIFSPLFHLRRHHVIHFAFLQIFFSRSISSLGSAKQARPTADRHTTWDFGGGFCMFSRIKEHNDSNLAPDNV